MAQRRFRGSPAEGPGYWPAFVDVLSNLLLVMIFLMSLFYLASLLAGQGTAGRDSELAAQKAKISELTDLVALAETEKRALESEIAQMRATLDQETARADNAEARIIVLVGEIESAKTGEQESSARIATLETELDNEKQISADALAKVELLNQQINSLTEQVATLEAALKAAEARDAENQAKIEELNARLSEALTRQQQEIDAARSVFFTKLKEALGDRKDITVSGDRFVLPAEIFFDSGSAQINEAGKAELKKVARILNEVAAEIPSDIKWILRVDGHTDKNPIATAEFPSNWHLSFARALSVTEFLIAEKVPAKRVVPAGFAQYHPIDSGTSQEALRRNRRIEFKLTDG